MTKGSIHLEDKTIINIYAPNISAPKYVKQILTYLKAEIDGKELIVRNITIPPSTTDRSSRRKSKGNIRLERHFIPNAPNRHIQKSLSKRAHEALSGMLNKSRLIIS